MMMINYTQEELRTAVIKVVKHLAKKKVAKFEDYDIDVIIESFPNTPFLQISNQTAVEVYGKGISIDDLAKNTNRIKKNILFDLRDFQTYVSYGMGICETRNRARIREEQGMNYVPIEDLGMPDYLVAFCKNNGIDTIGKLRLVCNEEEKIVYIDGVSIGNEQKILSALKHYLDGELNRPRAKAKNTGRRTKPGKMTVKW